jgi:hypothetical protein
MEPIEGDHKACCEALYQALENLAGDIFGNYILNSLLAIHVDTPT